MAKGDSIDRVTGPIDIEDLTMKKGFLQVPILLLERGVSLGAAATYAALHYYVQVRHTGYPGHEQCAEDFGQGARSIRRHLKELIDGGFIETFRQGPGQPLGFKIPRLKSPLEEDIPTDTDAA